MKIAVDGINVVAFKYQWAANEIEATVPTAFLTKPLFTDYGAYCFYVDNGVVKERTEAELKAQPAYNNYQKRKRAEAYKELSDPLFFKYQRAEITKQEWLDKVEEIKSLYSYYEED